MADGDLQARAISVPSIIDYFSDDVLNSEYHSKAEYQNAISKYGAIYKVVNFSEVEEVDKLKEYGRDWIRRNYFDGVMSFNVKAVDLHLLNYPVDKLLCGDRIPVEFIDTDPTPVTKVMTCISAQYDLLKPEASSFKIGIPEVSSNIKYRKSVNKQISTGTTKKKTDEQKEDATDAAKEVITDLVEQGYLDASLPWNVEED